MRDLSHALLEWILRFFNMGEGNNHGGRIEIVLPSIGFSDLKDLVSQ